MRSLVTGGAGFIGSYLCEELYNKGWGIRIIDINDKAERNPHFEYIFDDILNYPILLRAMQETDWVIHLAAKHRFFGVSEDDFYRVNVTGTENILKALSEVGIGKIIFFSSVAVYGDQKAPTDEDTTPKPNTIYGITKLEAEKRILNWVSEKQGRSALIIRPTVVFGPGNKGNMYRLIRQIDKHLYFPIGKGDNIKSTVYIGNIIDATLFLINKGFNGVEVYNYADHPDMSFKEITNIIYRLLGRSSHKYFLPANILLSVLKPFEFLAKISKRDFLVSTAIMKMNKTTYHRANKIRRAGFQQVCSVEEGLKHTVEWYKSNNRGKIAVTDHG